jgi:lysophospholipid hydrolase
MSSAEAPDTSGNPLVALAVAVIGAILYVLQGIEWMVAWVTLTIPRYVLLKPL